MKANAIQRLEQHLDKNLPQQRYQQNHSTSAYQAQEWTAEFTHFNQHKIQLDMKHPPNTLDMNSNWTQEFQQFQYHPQPTPAIFEETFNRHLDWNKEFEKYTDNQLIKEQPSNQQEQWINEFQQEESKWINEFQEGPINEFQQDPIEPISSSAAKIAAILSTSNNPKLRSSKFLGLMNDLKDGRAVIQGQEIVENKQVNHDWINAFDRVNIQDESMNIQNHHEPFYNQATNNQLAMNSQLSMNSELAMNSQLDDAWLQSFNQIKLNSNPSYKFSQNNQFLAWNLSELEQATKEISTKSLIESILILEAFLQKQSNPQLQQEAWFQLGLKHQENENDLCSILAFEQIQSGDRYQDALLALCVSFCNESQKTRVLDYLQRWIQSKYGIQPTTKASDPLQTKQEFVKNMLLDAAKWNFASSNIDADVQVGLGILFHNSAEYEKAIDCFETALSIRPFDYLLWNRLGATLANLPPSANIPDPIDRSMDAYYNALKINPSFTRVRFNIAISLIQMGHYREAVEHLVRALKQQQLDVERYQQVDNPNCVSENLWKCLNMILQNYMNRPDLLQASFDRNLQVFEGEF